MRLTIIAFNFGPSRSFTNGPGMSLFNFYKAISKEFEIDLFLEMKPDVKPKNISIYSIKDIKSFIRSTSQSSLIHHWGGLTRPAIRLLESLGDNSNLILGPNLLDCAEIRNEKILLEKVKFKKILSVNDRIKKFLTNIIFY